MEVARVRIKKRRTRGESTEASSGTVKRTKQANDGELTPSSPTIIQLRRSAGDFITMSPCLDDPPTVSDYGYASHTSDHVATSCCSSNSSTEFGNDGLQNLDLQFKSTTDETVHIEVETSTSVFNCRESELEVESVSVVSASQEALESATKKPSESELEEFFSAAEKSIKEQFIQKYNYDIAKDAPLEGRYEWIEMKP